MNQATLLSMATPRRKNSYAIPSLKPSLYIDSSTAQIHLRPILAATAGIKSPNRPPPWQNHIARELTRYLTYLHPSDPSIVAAPSLRPPSRRYTQNKSGTQEDPQATPCVKKVQALPLDYSVSFHNLVNTIPCSYHPCLSTSGSGRQIIRKDCNPVLVRTQPRVLWPWWRAFRLSSSTSGSLSVTSPYFLPSQYPPSSSLLPIGSPMVKRQHHRYHPSSSCAAALYAHSNTRTKLPLTAVLLDCLCTSCRRVQQQYLRLVSVSLGCHP
ncbi:hypothetical protein C8R45DRAFT_979039 [Mycena sanguinolenta]|nr:hypothetical protein C8R45DRAFT_979039 [Mycena sanguinolenta]